MTQEEATAAPSSTGEQPFSFSEIFARRGEHADPDPVSVAASDGVELAVTAYEPPRKNDRDDVALVFYHGGGAHSGAGYQHLAGGLSRDFGIAVYLPDLRGHGASGGARGDAPSRAQVWEDVDAVLDHVASRQQQRQRILEATSPTKLYLGGHSSGGGLVVNYLTEGKGATRDGIEGCVLVAPELGYRSGTARPDRRDFAKVNVPAFVANGIFGVLGHFAAVRFQYPPEILEADRGMVGFNTVNMANAITPESPKEQMSRITTGGGAKRMADEAEGKCGRRRGRPVGLWVGSEDELFVPEKVAALATDAGGDHAAGRILPGKTHLGILVDVHECIGRWIMKQRR